MKLVIVVACLIFLILAVAVLTPLPEADLSPLPVVSLTITDRNGEILREILSERETRAYWIGTDELPEHVLHAVIAAEDKRFFRHPGIDPIATARAIYLNVRRRGIVSGGSTITQQTIRNIYNHPRTIQGKLLEALYALRIERTLSKNEILTQYINRVPYGNGTHGIEAASRFYFGKPAGHLSINESAFLAGLPNAPSINNPYRSPERAVQRQRYVLGHMLARNFITAEEYNRAVSQHIKLMPAERNFLAPHFTEMVRREIGQEELSRTTTIRTTLDRKLQQTIEQIVRAHIISLKNQNVSNGAVVVINNKTGEVLALVGSADYNEPDIQGRVNGATALRQPGSALKPFTYGLALERGMTAAEMLADIPYYGSMEEGAFSPVNYDNQFRGPVLLREALACSYNIPAVRVAEKIGTGVLLHRLRKAGITSLDKSPSYYGLGLTLGNGEVRLIDLTNAYAAIARGGQYLKHAIIQSVQTIDGTSVPLLSDSSGQEIFSPQVAYILTDILSDNNARAPAFGFHSPLHLPFPCAAKTGTTKDYNDNWTIGYTSKYTVGVWIGNFDGKPMRGVSGITGSGAIFRDVMLFLEGNEPPVDYLQPGGITKIQVCAQSGELPTELCATKVYESFTSGTEPEHMCRVHRIYPVDIRTSRLADHSTPGRFTRDHIVEIYPPLFDAYFQNRILPFKSHPRVFTDSGFAGEVREEINTHIFDIVYPENGAVFKIDPVLRREYQNLIIRLAYSGNYRDIVLMKDGEKISSLDGKNTVTWNLERGEHEFFIEGYNHDRKESSRPVRVVVY
jgi:penicillin-binding protein 1C